MVEQGASQRLASRPARGLWLALLIGGLLLVGWMVVDARRDDAFEPQESVTRTRSPIEVGMEQLIGVGSLRLQVAGPVELTGAELIGLSGPGDVQLYAYDSPSQLGTLDRPASERDRVDGLYRPLAGVVITDPDTRYGLAVGVVTDEPGITTWDAIRIDYTVDGRPGSQRFANAGAVCAMEPPLTPCPDDGAGG